jgi:serine/threonine-protein kinase HipA
MAKSTTHTKQIHVYADWLELGGLRKVGVLQAEQLRGKEVFSFSYDKEWLESNFGLFMDSSPDRWGRVLMQRREALNARNEGRKPLPLYESDFLLGVYDLYRMGGLRFRSSEDGPFLHSDADMTVPPFTSLRTLEEASLRLEENDSLDDPAFAHWLNLLISPGSSLGGARPKASVVDPHGNLWIAKFPSRKDDRDMGAWEAVS